MNPSLQTSHLEAFSSLCQLRNFTRAAAKLGLTQSALSQRISNLEESLETTLVIRDKTGIRLTPAGYQLLRYCQARESLEAEAVSRIRSTAREELGGTIRIAGFSSIMASIVVPLFAPLLKAHPQVHLQCLARELDDLPDLLKRGEVDFILMDQALDREDWVKHLIGHEVNVLVEPEGYQGPNRFLENDENELTTRQYFSLPAHRTREKYTSHYVDDIYGILAGLREGVARAVMPRHLIRHEPYLKELRPGIELRVPVVLHYIEQAYYSKLHQLTVKTLIDGFRPAIDVKLTDSSGSRSRGSRAASKAASGKAIRS